MNSKAKHDSLSSASPQKAKAYSRRDSLVVSDRSTSLPNRGSVQDERTGIHALLCLGPYVLTNGNDCVHVRRR